MIQSLYWQACIMTILEYILASNYVRAARFRNRAGWRLPYAVERWGPRGHTLSTHALLRLWPPAL